MGWFGDRAAEAKQRYSKPGAFETIMSDVAVFTSVLAGLLVAAFIGHELLFHIKPDASQAIAAWVQAIGVPVAIYVSFKAAAMQVAHQQRLSVESGERLAEDRRRSLVESRFQEVALAHYLVEQNAHAIYQIFVVIEQSAHKFDRGDAAFGAGLRAALAAHQVSAYVALVAPSILTCASLLQRLGIVLDDYVSGNADTEVVRAFSDQAAVNTLICCEQLEKAADLLGEDPALARRLEYQLAGRRSKEWRDWERWDEKRRDILEQLAVDLPHVA